LKKDRLIPALVVLVVLAAVVTWVCRRIHFDVLEVGKQVSHANWLMILLGMSCIFVAYFFRSARWAMLLRHHQKVGIFSLTGTQVIGFTAVALLGRLADPVRPVLVAKKTGLPVSQQIAVYIVERLFDMGAMALVVSMALLPLPADVILKASSHSKMVMHLAATHPDLAVAVARFGGLGLTLCGALFLVIVRFSGEAVASIFEHLLAPISKGLANSIGHKIRAFHSGLDTMRSFGDLAITLGLSVSMWLLIAASYYITCASFTGSAELASITPSKCVLLMVWSGTASILQLPVIGWFSQIFLVAGGLTGILGCTAEAATACAAALLLVTFLCVIPIGLVWAQFEKINLRTIAEESGKAEE